MAGGIKLWPEGERPRERLLKNGAEGLSDAELLALIIRTGDFSAKVSAIDLGRELLRKFGDLRGLAQASVAEICRIKGTGPAKAASIKAALELAGRCSSESLSSGDRYTAPSQIFQHFQNRFKNRKKEHVVALLLDGKNRIIREVPISEGSLNQSIIHPREVFNPAVRDSAAAIILVHNHPTGDPTPSREDLELTRRLKEAGELMGIRVLDHVIIGDKNYVSLADKGYL
ncbi:DNA repair protein RadC [Geobacter pelophilus]|uniref:DNA repair protein RadC n=1 Tax=Geoanaerobacter pelophilus TaxID=60036 RepID=A0AAW4KZ05_9BACT|nr:DNA repair protein RadC [Geoanaerobacter pelophilus]